MDLAKAIAPKCKTEIIGIRPGEKLHEVMIPRDESRMALEFDKFYIIQPKFWFFERRFKNNKGKSLPEDFEYNSRTNTWWLTVEELREMIKNLQI